MAPTPPNSLENPTARDWAATRGDKWSASYATMEATLAPVDEPLIHALRLDAPASIAEVGSGGGGTALQIFRRAPAGSTVHGYDLSPKLVEIARGRIPQGETRVGFDVADMSAAAPPAPYQRLASRFGVMFFDDPPAAFANLARWLAPGGRFAFAVWGPPPANPWMRSARDVVARFVELPAADPQAPGPFRYGDASVLLGLLRAAGFADLDVHDWRGALPIGGGLPPEAAATMALTSFSTFDEVLARAGDEVRHAAQRALTEHYGQHVREGAVWMDACVHLVTGTR